MLCRIRRLALYFFLPGSLLAADPMVRHATRIAVTTVAAASAQPVEFCYPAFPSLLQVGPDEVWIVTKAGRSHATDGGAAMEVRSHTLSTGETRLIQRLIAPAPKLYQMGELARFSDGSIAMYMDVQAVGWDGRHSRTGVEVSRWDATRRAFGSPEPLGPIGGVLYGYPFEFITEGRTTWQLIMAFGYHLPGGRWSVDAVRSDDAGHSWNLVRNLTDEFGGIRANESGFVRHGDGFIVTTRGYDSRARLHRTDRDFRVQHQTELTGKYPFINSHVGRPRIFVRDGQGYLIGRNWTQPAKAESGREAAAMQLCLIRFDPQTLVVTACVILDNAENSKVTDGYYAVTAFSGKAAEARLHVVTYKALNGQPPDILRFDYRWSDVK